VGSTISQNAVANPLQKHLESSHHPHVSITTRSYFTAQSLAGAMNNLAPELLHMICANLYYWEIPNFRLINRDCAAVGLEVWSRNLTSISIEIAGKHIAMSVSRQLHPIRS
jgi:hypothetical protein